MMVLIDSYWSNVSYKETVNSMGLIWLYPHVYVLHTFYLYSYCVEGRGSIKAVLV